MIARTLATRLYAACMQHAITSGDVWMAAAVRDGIRDTTVVDRWRLEVNAMRCRIAMAVARHCWRPSFLSVCADMALAIGIAVSLAELITRA